MELTTAAQAATTRSWVTRFEAEIARLEALPADSAYSWRKPILAAYRSEVEDLQAQLAVYEGRAGQAR